MLKQLEKYRERQREPDDYPSPQAEYQRGCPKCGSGLIKCLMCENKSSYCSHCRSCINQHCFQHKKQHRSSDTRDPERSRSSQLRKESFQPLRIDNQIQYQLLPTRSDPNDDYRTIAWIVAIVVIALIFILIYQYS